VARTIPAIMCLSSTSVDAVSVSGLVTTMPEWPQFSNCDHGGQNRPPSSVVAMPKEAATPPYCIVDDLHTSHTSTPPPPPHGKVRNRNAHGIQEKRNSPWRRVAAVRLLEDLELGVGAFTSHGVHADARARNHKKARASAKNRNKTRAKPNKQGKESLITALE
jgi:hypothetical protein